MKLINKSQRNYIYKDIVLKAGEIKDIADEKACKILLLQPGVEKYVDIAKVEELTEENELNKLKVEAMELGVKFSKNIGLKALQKKIDEHKENLESEAE